MSETIFKRKIYEKMLEWKAESGGKSALLIEGPRRVGKSTIAEEFARNEYDDYILIDFATAEPQIVELFNYVSDINRFFLGLQTLAKKTLPTRRAVIIFDEVQFCPKARQAIKYLVKDGRYDYIETGSLISIKKNVENILIPSEEHRINMHPMDFEEFLWAIGKAPMFELIRHCYEKMSPLGEAMNRSLMREFRLYMLVGGMPQAVLAFINSNDFAVVDRVKRDIIALYEADFRKIDPLGRASTVFNHIPAELARGVMRYKVGSVIDGARPYRMGELFADIVDSRTVNIAYHTNDPAAGLALYANHDFFKLYLVDTGLFVTLAFMDNDYTGNEIYGRLLSDKLSANLGYVYENVIAQLLASAGHSLYYYTFKDKSSQDGGVQTYEIDFLLRRSDKLCPLEVKSSGYKSHKSLDKFLIKYSSRASVGYLLYTKDLRREGNIICLPVYMAGIL